MTEGSFVERTDIIGVGIPQQGGCLIELHAPGLHEFPDLLQLQGIDIFHDGDMLGLAEDTAQISGRNIQMCRHFLLRDRRIEVFVDIFLGPADQDGAPGP